MSETSPRVRAAARVVFNTAHDYDPADTEAWGELSLKAQQPYIDRGAGLVAAIDAADDRIRLTLPQFHAIKAQTVSDLSIDLHSRFGADRAAEDVLDMVATVRAGYGEQYVEPVNFEEAMGSLIRERLSASLRSTADFFDHASLDQIKSDMRGLDLSPLVSPQFQRRFIQGCAGWLRTRAEELAEETRIPYRRVDTRAIIDEDRHTAVLGVIGRLVRRANSLAQRDGMDRSSFIMTDMLVEELGRAGADVGAA
ncbi:MAG TPA: hypothetical protein VF867_11915 [Arthrobacter sp.]